MTRLQNEVKRHTNALISSRKFIDRLIAENEWIERDRSEFGKTGTLYDFSKLNLNESQKQLAELREQQHKLTKKINHKVMSMFERAENEYRDLIRKREIVRNDKKKIESVISELDKKKEDTLQNTWQKVNYNFNNIFSKLLPGTQCKLEPPMLDDGGTQSLIEGTVLDGLEVKVAFGDVWKETLTELSGICLCLCVCFIFIYFFFHFFLIFFFKFEHKTVSEFSLCF